MYDIILSYERPNYRKNQSLDHEANTFAKTIGLGLPHSTNLPVFDVLALDFIRTLWWTVEKLPLDPVMLLYGFRSEVPDVRGFAISFKDGEQDGETAMWWADHQWVIKEDARLKAHFEESRRSANQKATTEAADAPMKAGG